MLTENEKKGLVFGLLLIIGLMHGVRSCSTGSVSPTASGFGDAVGSVSGRIVAPLNDARLAVGNGISHIADVCPQDYRNNCSSVLKTVRKIFGLHE